MPTGIWKMTDIPTQTDVDDVKQEYIDGVPIGDPPPSIVVEPEGGPGPWTVIATYPGDGGKTESFNDRT